MSAGGAWEVIVDKATLEVSKFMSRTTIPFEMNSNISQHMLALLDVSNLRDILIERNFSGLCGMIGCAGKPRGSKSVMKTLETLNINNNKNNINDNNDNESQTSSDDDMDAEQAELFRRYEHYRMSKNISITNNNNNNNNNEITSISLLNEENKKKEIKEGTGGGVTMEDRFCSSVCANEFKLLLSKLESSLVYSRDKVIFAVAGLFPNMNLAALQKLAGAESTVVANIREKETNNNINDNNISNNNNDNNNSTEVTIPQPQLRELLENISAVGNVWSYKVQEISHDLIDMNNCKKRKMPVYLMVYDWLLTFSTIETRNIFAKMCYIRNNSNNNNEKIWIESENLYNKNNNLYIKCMHPIRLMCLSRGEELMQNNNNNNNSTHSINSILHQERLVLFASHVFSEETTATLSRLLLYDQSTLELAWSVWRNCELLSSFFFPFALPGIMTCGGVSSFQLFLALVFAAAAGLCEGNVWKEWLQDEISLINSYDNNDNNNNNNNNCTLMEVLEAVGATPDDLVACVQALVAPRE